VVTSQFPRNKGPPDYSIVEPIAVLDHLKDIRNPPDLHPTMIDNRQARLTQDCCLGSRAEVVMHLKFKEEYFEF
jgi:hypothetical protein